ncbi:hypothetical protein ACKI1J_04965 [Streptomyces scabiei]|uniref:hypothetical protein n=1 Tax=Streptomyces scabiei TaxID=1930 RepID=UPI0038F7C213
MERTGHSAVSCAEGPVLHTITSTSKARSGALRGLSTGPDAAAVADAAAAAGDLHRLHVELFAFFDFQVQIVFLIHKFPFFRRGFGERSLSGL